MTKMCYDASLKKRHLLSIMKILITYAEITIDHLASLMRIRKRLFLNFIYVCKCVIRFNISRKYYDFHLNSYRKNKQLQKNEHFKICPLGIKFGLAVKKVKVKPDSSFRGFSAIVF